MQRFFSIIVIFGILVAGGGYLWMKKSDEETRQRVEESLASARRSFADKARAAVGEEQEDGYLRGIRAALAAYEEELKKVYAEAPELRDPAAFSKQVEASFEKGEIQEAQRKSMLEGYAYVKEAHEVLTAATWRPILTARGNGDIRIDIHDVRRIRDDEGNPILEARALFWGIEDSTRVSWGALGIRYWTLAVEPVKEGRRTVEKEVEKVLGKAEGDATPRVIMQNPGKYIAEFPSFVSPGYIWFPVMPREARYADLEYAFAAKKGGDTHDVKFTWAKLEIPEKWKLGEGESWEADVVEASAEEIAGTDGQTDGGVPAAE